MTESIKVEVVYATPDQQRLITLRVPEGTTAIGAIERSNICDEFPGMVVDEKALGVFSRRVSPDYELEPGDRVEIYRPLIADPKEIRRKRAKTQKSSS